MLFLTFIAGTDLGWYTDFGFFDLSQRGAPKTKTLLTWTKESNSQRKYQPYVRFVPSKNIDFDRLTFQEFQITNKDDANSRISNNIIFLGRGT